VISNRGELFVRHPKNPILTIWKTSYHNLRALLCAEQWIGRLLASIVR
jgi:hypothetical protein